MFSSALYFYFVYIDFILLLKGVLIFDLSRIFDLSVSCAVTLSPPAPGTLPPILWFFHPLPLAFTVLLPCFEFPAILSSTNFVGVNVVFGLCSMAPFCSLAAVDLRGKVVAVRRYCTASSTVVISPGSFTLSPPFTACLLLKEGCFVTLDSAMVVGEAVVGLLFKLDELELETLKQYNHFIFELYHLPRNFNLCFYYFKNLLYFYS